MAVDVAILPPPDVTAVAETLSASLPQSEGQGLTLDATHLPHITLTQQFVPTGDLTRIGQVLHTLLQCWTPFPLQVVGPGRGSNSVWMAIGDSDPLHRLHVAVMEALRPFERRDGAAAAFADADARRRDVDWVANFRTDSAYERFTPHITLGHASELPRVEPLQFDAETIALCQLGRFCTCRRVIQSWTLTSPRS